MAFVIEPPTVEAADDLVILCSDECPYADGQTWDAPSGVVSHFLIYHFSRASYLTNRRNSTWIVASVME